MQKAFIRCCAHNGTAVVSTELYGCERTQRCEAGEVGGGGEYLPVNAQYPPRDFRHGEADSLKIKTLRFQFALPILVLCWWVNMAWQIKMYV